VSVKIAENSGIVEYVDSEKVIIKYDRTEDEEKVAIGSNIKTYNLTKFLRTNQGTCINLKPLVVKGQRIDLICSFEENN